MINILYKYKFLIIVFFLISSKVLAFPGSLDLTFNPAPNLGPNSTVESTVKQNDGKIIVAGHFKQYNGKSVNYLTRLNTDGSIDQNFIANSGIDTVVKRVILQADGKIIICGQFQFISGNYRPNIARLNSDGSLDTGFSPLPLGVNGTIYSAALQSNGKIIVVGSFTSFASSTKKRIVRLNSNGTVDNTFDHLGSGFDNGAIVNLCVQSDDKLVLGGTFTSFNGVQKNRIIRLNSNGAIDNTFSIGTGASNTVYKILQRMDGKILVVGDFNTFNGSNVGKLVRLNSDGTLDANFNSKIGANDAIITLALETNNKILIGGYFSTYKSKSANRIARLNDNGSLDSTFITGLGFDYNVADILLDNNNGVIVSGSFSKYNGVGYKYFLRLNGGDCTPSYKTHTVLACESYTWINGITYTSNNNVATHKMVNYRYCDSIIQLNLTIKNKVEKNDFINACNDYTWIDGKKYYDNNTTAKFTISGGASNGCDSIVNLKLNIYKENHAIVDNSFNISGAAFYAQTVHCLAKQKDNKIIIGGEFTTYNNIMANSLVRILPNATIDTSFKIGSGFFNSAIYTIAVQSDGKIIVGGNFTSFNGVLANKIIRLNSNGTIDNTFNSGVGFNNNVRAIEIQNDGKILLCGEFTSFNGVACGRIVRINTNGSIDNNFYLSSGANNAIYGMKIQSDGKITIGGSFTTFNGTNCGRIIRLTSDGNIDPAFNTVSGANSTIMVVCIQNDGKILIGGDFTSYSSTNINRVARLNIDGSLDNTFNIGTGTVGSITAMVIQQDKKIIISGAFRFFNNVSRNGVVRIYEDGTVDNSFIPSVISNFANALLIQSDNKIVFGGGSIKNIARLVNSSSGTDIISSCKSHTWINGVTYTEDNYSATHVLTNKGGCDSIAYLNLTIKTSLDTTVINVNNELEAKGKGLTYQWLSCNNNYSSLTGENNYVFTPKENGSYAVTISKDGCKDTSNCHEINMVITNLNKTFSNFDFSIYPNPSAGKFKVNSNLENNCKLKIFNLLGCQVLSDFELSKGQSELDLSNLQKGVYIIKIHLKESVFSEKIIIN